MTTHMVRLSEDAYNMLKARKKAGETFSDVVRKVCIEQNSKLWGLVGILTDEEGEEMLRIVKEGREESARVSDERFRRWWGDDTG